MNGGHALSRFPFEDRYVAAALCAQRAGFDGVDIKAYHRYLVSELLASQTRLASRYGGSLENRTRLLRNAINKIRACSSCTQIMRDGGRTGCVPRDAAVYEPIYRAGRNLHRRTRTARGRSVSHQAASPDIS